MNNENFFPDQGAMTEALCKFIAQTLQEAIDQRQHAYLVVSGGSTPGPVFDLLCTEPLAWDKVTITLSDERWISTHDSDSNEYLIKERLLQDKARAANFISLWADYGDPTLAMSDIDERLGTLPRFDLVLLGMGLDGHTASLFPCSSVFMDLQGSESENCIAVYPQNAPYARMSLTPERILDTRQIVLLMTGEEKKAVYENTKSLTGSSREEKPVSLFLNQETTPAHIYWAP